MIPNGEYLPVDSQAPFKGLATTPPSTQIGPAYSPDLLNCSIREDGLIQRRAGYTQLGRRLVGRILAQIEFGSLSEDPFFVVLTSHRQYYYDSVSQDYIDLTPGQQTYPITDVTLPHTFKIAGDHTLDFLSGRLFPIMGGLNQGVYTVNGNATFGAGKTTIVVVETLPSAVVGGNAVVADDFTTGDRDQLDFEDVTDISGRRLILTNGQDQPRFWTGDTSSSFNVWTPAFTNFVTMKTIRVFAEHLMLGGITSTNPEPHTIAWSTAGDFEDFNTGTSGVQILYQLTMILVMEILGDRLAIYSDDAIMTGVFIDIPAIFAFEVVVAHGTRFVGLHGLVSINVGHIYLSEQNIFLFDGSRGLRVLSDLLATDYRKVKDQENLHLVGSTNDYAKRVIYLSIPSISGGSVIYTLFYDVFNLSMTTWSKEVYAHTPRSFGFFINRAEVLTWEDASWEPTNMPWSDEVGSWGEEAEQRQFPIRTFGTNDGDVFLITEGVLDDNGIPFTQRYDTMDFSVPQASLSLLGRWKELEFEGYGTEVDVSYSMDQGQNFSPLGIVTLNGSPDTYIIPFDLTSRTLRFRFSSVTDFALRWIRSWVRPGAARGRGGKISGGTTPPVDPVLVIDGNSSNDNTLDGGG